MRRVCLTVTGMCLIVFHAFSQTTSKDSVIYITGYNGRSEAIPPGGTGKQDKKNVPSSPRDSYSASFSYSQVFNPRLQPRTTSPLMRST